MPPQIPRPPAGVSRAGEPTPTAPTRTAPSDSAPSDGARVRGVLLTPGAGAGRDNSTLLAIEHRIAPTPCLRLDFGYRLAGRRIPDRPPVAVAHIVEAATTFAGTVGASLHQIILGGRSYGGRMCSMAVAQGMPAAGLVLLSYPLHPPGAPQKVRVDHFPAITVPVLLISGEKDPFGTQAEFAEHLPNITGPTTVAWLPGGHDPRADADVATIVANWLARL